jgi:hypothetical protein
VVAASSIPPRGARPSEGERVEGVMVLAGESLYRVIYRCEGAETEFARLVIAHSEKEAMAHIKGSYSAELIERDISLLIPDQYLPEPAR